MTVAANTWRAGPYTGNGVATAFAFNFTALAQADLRVVLTVIDTDVEADLVLDSDYSVTLNPDQDNDPGGTITYPLSGSPMANTHKLTIVSNVPLSQLTDITNAGGFYPEVVEDAIDKLTIITAQMAEQLGRAVKVPVSSATDPDDIVGQINGYVASAANSATAAAASEAAAEQAQSTVTELMRAQVVNVRDPQFAGGAKGNGVADDQPAIQAAVNYLIAAGGGHLYFPPGRYLSNGRIEIYRPNSPRIDLFISGADPYSSVVIANFYGADDALFSSVDPALQTRSSPVSFRNLDFEHKSRTAGPNPAFIHVAGWGESRLENVRFEASNNTVLRGGGMQNIRANDVVSYYGGKSYIYKDATGITFSIDGTTLMASAAIFTAADVGKHITLWTSAGNRKMKIAAYVNAQQVTTVENSAAVNNVPGHFQPAVASMSVGTTLLYTDPATPCFTADDVGRVVYVRNAKNGTDGGAATLRATIETYVAPHAVHLNIPAERSVTDVFFATPCFDFYKPDAPGMSDTLKAGSSDVKLSQLHIEHYAGLAFGAINCDAWDINQTKIHGETSPSAARSSSFAMWLDDFEGSFSGEWDSSCSLADCRAWIANQKAVVSLPKLSSRSVLNEIEIRTAQFVNAGGYVKVGDLQVYRAVYDVLNLFVDGNGNGTDARIELDGFFNSSGDGIKGRRQLGRNLYAKPSGELVRNGVGEAGEKDITSTITWNGTAPSSPTGLRYQFTRQGDLCFFSMRGEYAVAGAANSTVDIVLPADMPRPKAATGLASGEVHSSLSGFMSASNNSVPALTKAYLRDNGAGTYELKLALNSSTINALLLGVNGFYFCE